MKAGKLMVLVGASRSGKSAYLLSLLPNYDTVLIWDVKGEYEAVKYRPRTAADLVRCVKAGEPGTVAFFEPPLSAFDFFCKVAQTFAKLHAAAGRRCAIVIEETSDVTRPGKAPESYGILLRRYLGTGVDIFAVCQRLAESDKTSIGNASQVHICRLTLPNDRKTVAAASGVPLALVESLRADQDAGRYEFVHVDLGRGEYRPGVLTWQGKRPQFTPTGAIETI